jgi:5-methylcytosine-specific restriction protein A
MRSPSDWENLPELTKTIQEGNSKPIRWSCGKSKLLQKGDRVFLIKLGKKPKGLFASGYIVQNAYEDFHWEYEKAKNGERSCFVKVKLDTLMNPYQGDEILSRELLNNPPFSKMHWDTQMSGIRIPDDIATQLEVLWSSFKNSVTFSFPEEVEEEQGEILEGAVRQVIINAYERNPEARRKCINHYGAKCVICEFDFFKKYGEIGKGFIHVYHLKQISEIGKTYQVDPVKDLRPVCPNCHAIIHKRRPPYTMLPNHRISPHDKKSLMLSHQALFSLTPIATIFRQDESPLYPKGHTSRWERAG